MVFGFAGSITDVDWVSGSGVQLCLDSVSWFWDFPALLVVSDFGLLAFNDGCIWCLMWGWCTPDFCGLLGFWVLFLGCFPCCLGVL